MAMIILIVVAAWLLLTMVGWLVLAPLDRARRNSLLPTAPLWGVALLVVVLHDTTLVLPTRHGVWVVGAVLVGFGVLATLRDRTWWRPSLAAIAALGLSALCAVLPAVWALGPALAVGQPEVIQPSDANDAFYYVSVIDWLQDHPATDTPSIASAPGGASVPPSYHPAQAQLESNLRIGQELTQAGLDTVLRQPPSRTWYLLTALWVLLLPASGIAAARLLRLRLATGVALGLTASVSSVVVFQLAAQNSDSLLGSALAPAAIAAVVAAVERKPTVPVGYASVMLTALVGTYTEFVPLIGLALVLAVVVRKPREIRDAIGRSLGLILVALVISPLIWIRAVRSLLFLGGLGSDNLPTAFAGAPTHVLVARFLGVAGPTARSASAALLVVVFGLVAVGVVAATVLTRSRWCWLALVAVGVYLAIRLEVVDHRSYTQQRLVQLLVPLVLLVTAVGWDALVRASTGERPDTRASGRRARRTRRAPVIVTTLGLAGAVTMVLANSAVDYRLGLPDQAEAQHVDGSFAEAAGWIRRVGGTDGANASVLVGNFFSQLWITDALRHEPDVAYPSLFVSYQGQNSYWNGQPRRWLLVDRTAIRAVGPSVVVRRNARFALLDLGRGRAVVAVPGDEFGANSFVVLRSARGPTTAVLNGFTERRAAPPPADPALGDAPTADALRPGNRSLAVDLGSRVAVRLVLSDATRSFVVHGIGWGADLDNPSP